MKPLTILLYGDFTPDRLAGSYEQAFLELGHSVTRFDTRHLRSDLGLWCRGRLAHRLTQKSLNLRRAGSRRWNERLAGAVEGIRPDLLLILNGDLVMPATLQWIRTSGTRVFIFHADNPFPPFTGDRPESLPAARESDAYFIWSRRLVKDLAAIGVPRAEYLPFAWDPHVFPLRPPEPVVRHDVVFVGGWDRERERLLECVAGHFDLKIWGPDYWGTRTRPGSWVRRAWQGTSVSTQEAACIVSQSQVVLNILRRQNLPDGTIMRTFEVPGSGSAQLSTRTEGALEIFPEGQAGWYFGDEQECLSQVEAMLSSNRRLEVGQVAHDIVAQGHRYVDRARRMLEVYFSL